MSAFRSTSTDEGTATGAGGGAAALAAGSTGEAASTAAARDEIRSQPDHYRWEPIALAPFAEDYRRLVATLLATADRSRPLTVALAGAVERSGTSTVAAGLALSLARHTASRVLLIDGHFARPAVSRLLEVEPEPGLAEVLEGRCAMADATRAARAARLHVIPAGRAHRDPMQLFGLASFRAMFEQPEPAYDVVIVDAPPIMRCAESVMVSSRLDGTVLVVRASLTPWEVAQRAADRLRAAHVNVLGVVLNGCQRQIPNFLYRRL